MSFTPRFTTQLMKPLLRNLRATLQARMPEALPLINVDLDEIKTFKQPVQLAKQFPALFVEPVSVALAENDDGGAVQGEYELRVSLSVIGQDSAQILDDLMDYVLAVDQIIRGMTADDWKGGDPSSKAIAWEPIGQEYELRVNAEGALRGDARIQVIVQRTEQ